MHLFVVARLPSPSPKYICISCFWEMLLVLAAVYSVCLDIDVSCSDLPEMKTLRSLSPFSLILHQSAYRQPFLFVISPLLNLSKGLDTVHSVPLINLYVSIHLRNLAYHQIYFYEPQRIK